MSGDVSDLVERLRDIRSGHPLDIACHMDDLCMEAAIALEAKEAEIAVKTQAVADMARTIAEFQERVKELEAEAPRLLTEQRRTLCAEHDKDIQKLRRAKEIILDMEARAETAERKLADVSRAIGSVRFMDPPDGGSVTLAEQVERMRIALEAAERENGTVRSECAKTCNSYLARAIDAERERDEARAALLTAEQMISEHIEEFHDFDYAPHEVPRELSQLRGVQHHLLGSLTDENGEPFRAARALIEKGDMEVVRLWNEVAAIASGALVPASAVAEMRERCAAIADKAMVEFTLLLEYHAVSNSKSAAECATLCAKAAREIADKVRQLDTVTASEDYVVVRRSDLTRVVDIAGRNEAAPEIGRVRAMLNAASRTGGGK